MSWRLSGWKRCAAIIGTLLVVSVAALAQGSPRVTGVDPAAAKVGDSITVQGENLGKGIVAAVYLSDNTDDHKAVIVEQAADKIIIKVPKVKAGDYNVSIQIKNDILIQPVRVSISESE
jgi:hypothetical protein